MHALCARQNFLGATEEIWSLRLIKATEFPVTTAPIDVDQDFLAR